MGREERRTKEVQQKEYARLSEGVTRAIATLIHVDEFIQRTAIIFEKYVDKDGVLDESDVPTKELVDSISLMYKLHHGTFNGDADLFMDDIKLISRYNEFDYSAYIAKMHEMILTDEASQSGVDSTEAIS